MQIYRVLVLSFTQISPCKDPHIFQKFQLNLQKLGDLGPGVLFTFKDGLNSVCLGKIDRRLVNGFFEAVHLSSHTLVTQLYRVNHFSPIRIPSLLINDLLSSRAASQLLDHAHRL